MACERSVLEGTLEHALKHLEGLRASPVGATAMLTALRERLGKTLNENGLAPEDVIEDLVADSAGGSLSAPVRDSLAGSLAGRCRRRLQRIR